MSRAAILGCGYVGRAVAHRWVKEGFTVTATTTSPEKIADLEAIAHRVFVVRGNDPVALKSLLADQEILLVSVGAPQPGTYRETYLQTAKTLATVLPDTPVQQVIYTGSYAVYGDRQGNWVTEADPISPVTENGQVLAETEETLLKARADQRRVCIFRLGGIYGPGRELVKIFGRAAGSTRPGDGSDASNWIHLEDIVGAVEFGRSHALDGIYNLVQDHPTTVKTLLDRVMTVHNLAPVRWNPSQASVRPYNARVSNQKLKAAGYRFVYSTFDENKEGFKR